LYIAPKTIDPEVGSREELYDSARLRRGQGADDGIDVQDIRGFQKLETAREIDALPGGRADLFGGLGASGVAAAFLAL
jgi:hypothetical protein